MVLGRNFKKHLAIVSAFPFWGGGNGRQKKNGPQSA